MGSTAAYSGPEPIAVIGIGCRMPGDVRCPKDLWNLLMSERIANKAKVPRSRFNIDAYLHPSNERPGSFNVLGGYFLEDDPEAFDHGLFNISPVEALWMDPQQRKLLEVVYEAFESSGTTLETVSGQKTGCFVGSFTFDFQHMAQKESDFRHAYVSTGVDTGILGNRISYVFDLRGPSLTVNTACSSSLYALDLACKAIASGECDSAVVGGTNLILTVDQQMNTARLGVLSPTNQCHTFDDAADGYGRAEGVGALYIKPLSAAIRDGDPVRAVIRSTAASSSGKCKDGMTHPSVEGQVAVIQSAYQSAGLSPSQTSYVECHGTGTPVGDPIEVEAIHKAMGAPRAVSDPVLIGSVKPNIGHSEAASSMGTLIKAILALENGIIPPTVGITSPSKSIPWTERTVHVVTQPMAFPERQLLRRIGVSAFGYGGTNAHAILESADNLVPPHHLRHRFVRPLGACVSQSVVPPDEVAARPSLLLLSAHDEPTLKNTISDYARECKDADLLDLAYTLGVRRSKLARRTFAVCRKSTFATDMLEASSSSLMAPNQPTRIAFVFTGQGTQWTRMGAQLFDMYPTVLWTIQSLDRHLATLSVAPTWTIEEMLLKGQDSVVNDSEYSQPLCTAIQIVLVDLLASWNVSPTATIGHSSGEIAAAYAAGTISAEDAITAAYFRGKVAASLRSDGAMLAVGLGASEAQDIVESGPWRGRVIVACHNSPNAVTLSGDCIPIEQLKLEFDNRNIFARMVKTGGKAYHSHHMRDAAIAYESYLTSEAATAQTPSRGVVVPMFSTVRPERLVPVNGYIPASYWVDNLNSPVLFSEGLHQMLDTMPELNTIIELGPHPALAGSIRQICQVLGRNEIVHIPTLKRNEHDGEQMLKMAGSLWTMDADIDVVAVTSIDRIEGGSIERRTGHLLVDLPTYHWTYSKPCWTESRQSREHRQMIEPRHDILGRRVLGTSPLEPIWRNVLRLKDLPWLAQHRLGGEFMLPGSGYLALALEAITQINAQSQLPLPVDSYTVRNVVISTATVVPDDDEGTEIMFRLQPESGKLDVSENGVSSQWYDFQASCCAYGTWKETARGRVAINVRGLDSRQTTAPFPETPHRADHLDWLDKLRSVGFDLGPAFCHITSIFTNGKSHHARGDMSINTTCGLMEAESRYVLHPTVLDSCLQPFLATIHQGRIDEVRCGTIPTHFDEVTVYPPTPQQFVEPSKLQVWTPQLGNRAFSSNSQLIASDGALLVDISGCRNLLYGSAIPEDMKGPRNQDLFIKSEWKIDAEYIEWANAPMALDGDPIIAATDILLHKNISQRTLCLNASWADEVLAAHPGTDLTIAIYSATQLEQRSAKSVEACSIRAIEVSPQLHTVEEEEPFQLVLASVARDGQQHTKLDNIHRMMVASGVLLLQIDPSDAEEWAQDLHLANFGGVTQLAGGVVLATAEKSVEVNVDASVVVPGHVVLVYRTHTTPLLQSMAQSLRGKGWQVSCRPISSPGTVSGCPVLLLADLEGPLLADVGEEDLKGLIFLTENASAITWVTFGGLLTGDKPEYGMTAGAARVIRNEKGSLDLVTVDVDLETTSVARIAHLLIDILSRQRLRGRNGETEYCMTKDMVYVARLVAHHEINSNLVMDSGKSLTVYQCDRPLVYGAIRDGEIVYHKQISQPNNELGTEEVEVLVEAIGLTSSDWSDDSTHLSHEIAGEVSRVGDGVTDLVPGMKVVALAYGNLSTVQRTQPRFTRQLPLHITPIQAAAMTSAFVTATYALEDIGRIESGDYVAIVDGLSHVGLAALELCHRRGARAIVLSSSPSTSAYVADNGLARDNEIVSCFNGDISGQVSQAARGRGLDIVLCSSDSDHLVVTECIRCINTLGRVITVGGSYQLPASQNDLGRHGRNLSFAKFDLKDIMDQRPRAVSRILNDYVRLCREGKLRCSHPFAVHSPAGISNALVLRSTSGGLASTKNVLSYDETATFKVHPSPVPLVLRNDGTYLLVGCLGGLGRQVAMWMADRGVKHMAFFSRTGTDNTSAARTVQALRDRGVEVMVLRGDITKFNHVQDAVAQASSALPIRGIINAANVLHDRVFHNMDVESWRAVTDTKVKGCLNLHNALVDQPLDFFVMTSSITSTLGSTGQSNYGAANSFLDSLARHRRSRGLPAVSLILPAILGIGYLSERPEIVQSIKAKGMYGIYEPEMLRAFEIAMTPQDGLHSTFDHLAVGIQPRRYGEAIRIAGAYVPWKEDPRLNWLEKACASQAGPVTTHGPGATSGSQTIQAVIEGKPSPEKAVEEVTALLTRRLARLLMIDEAAIQHSQKSVASYGLDSMIGAEFRNWIFRESQVQVPFQRLLAGNLTVAKLARIIVLKEE